MEAGDCLRMLSYYTVRMEQANQGDSPVTAARPNRLMTCRENKLPGDVAGQRFSKYIVDDQYLPRGRVGVLDVVLAGRCVSV